MVPGREIIAEERKMGFGGRRAFRGETRTTRDENLYGRKPPRLTLREHLSQEEIEKRRADALVERERYRRERFGKDRPASD